MSVILKHIHLFILSSQKKITSPFLSSSLPQL